MNKNVLIVGDVHGCYDEMRGLIEQTRQAITDGRELMVLFVGDLVRKGPESLKVLRYVRDTTCVYSVRGNHEEKVLKSIVAHKNGSPVKVTLSETDLKWIHELTAEDFSMLKALPYTISIPALRITLVHGGVIPGRKTLATPPNVMMTLREVMWTDDAFHGEVLRPCEDNECGQAWARHWGGPEHIYFGHDAARKVQKHKNATGLDSGCVYGGDLTGVLLSLKDHPDTVECVKREFVKFKSLKSYRAIK